MKLELPAPASKIERRLMLMASLVVFLYAITLTLAPAARERSWNVEYRWSHWLGLIPWALIFWSIHIQLRKMIPDADPYLLPATAVLVGWGLMMIWRLFPDLGIRQTAWMCVGGIIILLGLRMSPDLHFLRRYKYIWLTIGLFFTALTLVVGTNPLGSGQRLWLGGAGFYLQPTEPLKLLLVIYLAAYLADRIPFQLRTMALLAPTAAVTGIALLLLFAQRDLGTTFIFIFLYTVMLYIASGKKLVALINIVGLVLASIAGYYLLDVVRLRVDAWLNPWLDPSGRSYQVVQALLAIANGGLLGRGPGMGSPGLVPVSVSDFIFTAIAEENGLVGTLGLLSLIGIVISRGIMTAMRASDRFRRILAGGLSAYIGTQSILIIGGNLRVFPLTGVTLPFVSYGGSSLVTSLFAVLLLLLISNRESEPAPMTDARPYLHLGYGLMIGIMMLSLTNGWWVVWRGPDLLLRTDNPRRALADHYVMRGSILDRNGTPINYTEGVIGSLQRYYGYPDLSPVVGYTNAAYGQAGLEASMDPYLRGLQGNPALLVWVDHLLYGQPPPGLNVRLSIDLKLQTRADSLLGNHSGAIILMDARSGEILVMASHPSFDPSNLDISAPELTLDPSAPLIDRAAQSLYPVGIAPSIFLQAAGLTPEDFNNNSINDLYSALGFYATPELRLPVASAVKPDEKLLLSPLQMILAAATISNKGERPVPRLVMAVDTPVNGWVIMPAIGQPAQALPEASAQHSALELMINDEPLWEWTAPVEEGGKDFTWYVGGTLPDWKGTPLVIVVLVEENNTYLVESIGQSLLKTAIR